jgi:hypothetical protein
VQMHALSSIQEPHANHTDISELNDGLKA